MDNTIIENSTLDLLTTIESSTRYVQRAVSALDDVVADKLNINKTDLRILDTLIDGPTTPSTLVKKTGITPSAMTTALDRLESQNYVIRKRDLDDRRKIFVEITDRCNRITAHLHGPIAKDHIDLLNKMSETELNIIYNYLVQYEDLYKRHRTRLKKEHYHIK